MIGVRRREGAIFGMVTYWLFVIAIIYTGLVFTWVFGGGMLGLITALVLSILWSLGMYLLAEKFHKFLFGKG